MLSLDPVASSVSWGSACLLIVCPDDTWHHIRHETTSYRFRNSTSDSFVDSVNTVLYTYTYIAFDTLYYRLATSDNSADQRCTRQREDETC